MVLGTVAGLVGGGGDVVVGLDAVVVVVPALTGPVVVVRSGVLEVGNVVLVVDPVRA
jgi:hypothetical protein